MTSKGSLRLRLTAFALLNLSISLLWDPFRFATPVFASSGNVLVFPQLVAGGGFISYISDGDGDPVCLQSGRLASVHRG
jgi:hypothetical protein